MGNNDKWSKIFYTFGVNSLNMNKEEAISILEQAVNAALIKGGVYSIEDMKLILSALESIKTPAK